MKHGILCLLWTVFFLPTLADIVKTHDHRCAEKLIPGQVRHVVANGIRKLHVFKLKQPPLSILYPFSDAHFSLDRVPSDAQLHMGMDCADIEQSADQYSLSNLVDWFFTKRQSRRIPAMSGLVGIRSAHDYTLRVEYDAVNPYRMGVFLLACVMFVSAKYLCHRAASLYTSSAFVGVFASVLFLFLFSRRFLPRTILFVPLDWVFWPVLSYAYYYGYANFYAIATEHWKYLVAYMAVSAVVSVALCYVSGVSANVRLRNVFQWVLQTAAVLLILGASQQFLFSLLVIVCLILHTQGVHRRVFAGLKWLFRRIRRERPVHVMLTEDEYRRQGEETTRAELEKLREFLADNCRTMNSKATPLRKLKHKEALGEFLVNGSDVSMRSVAEHSRLYGDEDEEEEETPDEWSAELTSDDDDELTPPSISMHDSRRQVVPGTPDRSRRSSRYSADFTDDSEPNDGGLRRAWRPERSPKSRHFNFGRH